VSVSVTDPSPAAVTYDPAQTLDGTQSATVFTFAVPIDTPSGAYPIIVSGANDVESHSAALMLIVDAEPPTAAVSSVRPSTGDVVGTDGRVPLHATWSTDDALSGVAAGSIAANSSTFGSAVSGSATYHAADGANTFVASATDVAGNSASSSDFVVNQTSFQESGATYRKTWSAAAGSPAWGTTRFSKTPGATATLTFNGTDVAWVSTRAPKRGRAKVYIDGVLATTVDLRASSVSSRQIVFARSGLTAGQHTIKIYVVGTANRPRVDVDGFVVLSQ
jgi:hypothetical protein